MDQPSPPVRLQLYAILAALILGAVALGLRLHGIERHSLWLDEAYAVQVASQDPLTIVDTLSHDNGVPFYYWLLHAWMLGFGDSEWAVRMLSVLFGVWLVPATGALAWRIAGVRAGWVAATLAATLPMAVQFSQEARMYALLSLIAVLAAERLIVYLETGRRGPLIAHVLLMVAGFYTHNWGLLLLPASALAVLAHQRDRLRDWCLAALGSILLYAPWIPTLVFQTGSPSYGFIERVQSFPAWQLPFRSLVLFSSGVGTTGGETRSLLPGWGGFLAAMGWILLLIIAMKHHPRSARSTLLLAGAPLVLALIPGLWGQPIYLLGRYEVLVLPLFLALVAAGVTRMPGRRIFPVVAGVWVSLLLIGSLSYSSQPQRRFPEKIMARTLAGSIQIQDTVVFTGLQRSAMEYYLNRFGAAASFESFPEASAEHRGWFDSGLYVEDPSLIEEARRHCPAGTGRTWVVATGSPTSRLLLEELSRCAQVASPFASYGTPHHYLLVARPAARERAAALPSAPPAVR